MKVRIAVMQVALLLAALVAAAGLAVTPAMAKSPLNHIAGFWLMQVTPDPGTGFPSYVNVVAITDGGQIVNVDPAVGASVGGWERLPGRAFAATFTGFLPGPQTLRYVVRATVSLDASGQNVGGPFHTDVLDLSGNLLFSYQGTVSGQRQAVRGY